MGKPTCRSGYEDALRGVTTGVVAALVVVCASLFEAVLLDQAVQCPAVRKSEVPPRAITNTSSALERRSDLPKSRQMLRRCALRDEIRKELFGELDAIHSAGRERTPKQTLKLANVRRVMVADEAAHQTHFRQRSCRK